MACRSPGNSNLMNDLAGSDVRIALIQRGMTDVFMRAGVPASNLLSIPNPCVPFSSKRIAAESNKEFQFVGRIVAEKGIEAFLAAARLAGVPVRIMGDGPLREPLAVKYPEFIFEGWCSRERVSELARNARMLVMPSLYPEPFGLVIPEAVSSGIPVILSASALLATEVIQNRLGLTINPDDIPLFAEILKKCATDDASIEAMSNRGFHEPNEMSMRPEQWVSELLTTYGQLSGIAGKVLS